MVLDWQIVHKYTVLINLKGFVLKLLLSRNTGLKKKKPIDIISIAENLTKTGIWLKQQSIIFQYLNLILQPNTVWLNLIYLIVKIKRQLLYHRIK